MKSKLSSPSVLTATAALLIGGPACAASTPPRMDLGAAELVAWGLLAMMFAGLGAVLRSRKAPAPAASRAKAVRPAGAAGAPVFRFSARFRHEPSARRSSPQIRTSPTRAGSGRR